MDINCYRWMNLSNLPVQCLNSTSEISSIRKSVSSGLHLFTVFSNKPHRNPTLGHSGVCLHPSLSETEGGRWRKRRKSVMSQFSSVRLGKTWCSPILSMFEPWARKPWPRCYVLSPPVIVKGWDETWSSSSLCRNITVNAELTVTMQTCWYNVPCSASKFRGSVGDEQKSLISDRTTVVDPLKRPIEVQVLTLLKLILNIKSSGPSFF